MCSNYRVVHKHSPTVGSLIVFVLDKTELFPKTHWLCSYNPEQHDKLNMQRHQDDCMTWLSRRASVGGEGGDGVGWREKRNKSDQICAIVSEFVCDDILVEKTQVCISFQC